MTAAAWEIGDAARLRHQLEQAQDVALYLMDVGVEQPQNFALGALQLSAETMPENSRLVDSHDGVGHRSAAAENAGDGGGVVGGGRGPHVAMVREEQVVLPTSRVQNRQEVELADNGSEPIEFAVSGLTKGTRHAELATRRPGRAADR